METLFRRYQWVVDIVVVAVCAGLGAHAAACLLGAVLVRDLEPDRRAGWSVASPTMRAVPLADGIADRNIFCSACLPVRGGPAGRASLDLRLLAIMFAPPPADPRWSIAIVRDSADQSTGLYVIGSKLGGGTVEEISETRVYLHLAGGHHEYLDLLDGGSSPRAAVLPDELDSPVRRTGAASFEIRRSAIEALLGDMPALFGQVRVVPEMRDGNPVGFRLAAIKAGSLLARAGLRDGDVISAINGLDVRRPDSALEAYIKLHAANHLSVALERAGTRIVIEYSIR